jgi:hypothetical protein
MGLLARPGIRHVYPVSEFVGLPVPLLPPCGDHTQSDEGEEERRGLGDLLRAATNHGGHEGVDVGYLDAPLSASPRQ